MTKLYGYTFTLEHWEINEPFLDSDAAAYRKVDKREFVKVT